LAKELVKESVLSSHLLYGSPNLLYTVFLNATDLDIKDSTKSYTSKEKTARELSTI